MSKFTLRDDGYSFKKIMQGKAWIGRVLRHSVEPRYLGIIGKLTVTAPTEREAFEEVVARHCGHVDAEAMRLRNRAVRVSNRQARAHGRDLARRFMHGDSGALEELVDAITRVGQ